jgi:hypothetical protein
MERIGPHAPTAARAGTEEKGNYLGMPSSRQAVPQFLLASRAEPLSPFESDPFHPSHPFDPHNLSSNADPTQ